MGIEGKRRENGKRNGMEMETEGFESSDNRRDRWGRKVRKTKGEEIEGKGREQKGRGSACRVLNNEAHGRVICCGFTQMRAIKRT